MEQAVQWRPGLMKELIGNGYILRFQLDEQLVERAWGRPDTRVEGVGKEKEGMLLIGKSTQASYKPQQAA